MNPIAMSFVESQDNGIRTAPPAAIGSHLRMARVRLGLTLKKVEERTAALAAATGNRAYRVSGSWLDRVERENRCLSATKLMVLAAVYNLSPSEMLAFCSDIGPSLGRVLSMPSPRSEHEATVESSHFDLRNWFAGGILNHVPPAETALLSPEDDPMPVHLRRVIIGSRDRSMEPMVPAGAIVLVDTKKRSISERKTWTNEFDRPAYVLYTRDGYRCGYCALDLKSEWLTLVPHMLSPEPQGRRWRFKQDVEIVGTIVAIFMPRRS